MTRLQRRNSSCDCGTTKESRSFVTKNKTYETRSGGQRKQEAAINGCHKKISDNLRGRVYLKKMENSLVSLPMRNGKINGESRVKLVKSSTKICNKNCNKNTVSNGTHPLLDTSLEEIITAKIKMDIMDINDGLLQKEDSPIPNGILAEEFVKTLNNRNNEGTVIQDGDLIKETDSVFVLNGKISESTIKKEENHIGTGKCDLNGTTTNLIDCENRNNIFASDDIENVIKKKNRRTRFEIFKDTSANSGLGIIHNKRIRKAPPSFSPETDRKCKQTEPSTPKMVQTLTKKGLPFKKKGRKPKPKGPIVHYLDLYMKNKDLEQSEKVGKSENSGNEDVNISEADPELIESSFNLPVNNCPPTRHLSCDSINNQLIACKSINLADCKTLEKRESCITKNDRRRNVKQAKTKNKKSLSKIETTEYSSPISQILGYRICNYVKEMLVLFEDGTSNWIPLDNNINTTNITEYYKHDSHDLSVINRLSYQKFVRHSFSDSDDIETSDVQTESNSEDSDCDEVFFQSLPSVLQRSYSKVSKLPLNGTYNRAKRDILSEVDFNNLCTHVISSKALGLYPCEQGKDVFMKADGEFFNIFLKQSVSKKLKKDQFVNLKSCEKLVTLLEDCAVDIQCKIVLISGIEDFFASNTIFEKLLKKTAALEGRKSEQDVSILRYLVQTIRNFNKPIVGIIKKTAMGLPASLLSLFDMVFHEEMNEPQTLPPSKKFKKSRKNFEVVENLSAQEDSDDAIDSEKRQTFIFPRLMGLTESNELRIMGERKRILSPNDITVDVPCFNKAPLSQQLRCSVRHMKNNSRIQIKSCSRSCSNTWQDELDRDDLPETNGNENNGKDTSEDLKLLENQIEAEKEKTEDYLSELMTYIDSIGKGNGFINTLT